MRSEKGSNNKSSNKECGVRKSWLARESFILPSHNPCQDSGTGCGGAWWGGEISPKVLYILTVASYILKYE